MCMCCFDKCFYGHNGKNKSTSLKGSIKSKKLNSKNGVG